MAVTIGDVTIRIGASTKTLNSDLRKAERALQASAAKFQSIGQSMSLSLTAPLVGLGIAATQSFGEFERLTKSLTAVVGDAGLAAEQFERLKVIAEAPGLALPQVVSASAKLQAVGLSAAEAEKTITEYGNAVARSGGNAESFDGAVLALTQIASKGKISAEELNQLGERIFEIRPALQAAFGTSNSEELQKLGISAQDFIARTTTELAKLQRVEGGLSNSFDNFRDSVTGSLAALGESISKSINLPKILDRISGALSSAADAFKELSPESQRFVVILGATIASIGPLAYVIGILKSAYGSVIIEIVKMSAALIAKTTTTTAETAATRVATATTITFNTALRATLLTLAPYALALGAIVAVAYGISQSMGEADKATEAYGNIQKQVASDIAIEKSKAEGLIKVINDETKSKKDRNQALKDLQAISPEYFAGLTIEKDGVKAINEQFNEYIGNLKAAATARAAEGEFQKFAVQRFELQKELNSEIAKEKRFKEESSKFDEATSRQGVDYAQTSAENSARRQEGIKNEIALLEQQENQLKDLIKQSGTGVAPKKVETTIPTLKPISDLTKQLKSLDVELRNIELLFNAGLITSQERAGQRADVLRKKLELLVTNGLSPTSQKFIELKDEIDKLQPKEIKVNVVSDLSDVNFEDVGLQLAKLENAVSFGLITPFDLAAEKTKVLQDQLKNLSDAGVDPSSSAVTNLKDQITALNDEQQSAIDKAQVFLQVLGLIPGKFNFTTVKKEAKDSFDNIFDYLGNKIANIPGIAEKLGGNIKELGPKISEAIKGAVGAVQGLFSTFGSLFDLQSAKIDEYEAKEKDRINNSILSEENKAAALAKIDEDVLQKRKVLARKRAAVDKAQAIFSATIAGANAILQALAVPIIGPVLAKVTAGLVAAQLAAIAATPLPSLAIGTDYVKQDGLAMLHKGEAVVPADVAGGGFSRGGMVNVSGRIQGTDILLVSDYAMDFKTRIR